MEMKKVVTGAAALSGLVTLGQTAVNADEIVVQAGDTVSELALKHNTTIEAIEQANKLQNVNLIFVGQRLEVGNNGVFNSQPVQPQAQAQAPTAEVEQPQQQQTQAQAQPQQQTQAPQVQAPVAPASDADRKSVV